MELNVTTCAIGMEETLLDAAVENPFDLDIHLPEYYPDIQRILKCSVRPNLAAVSAGSDRITAEGCGVLRMLYATDDKKVVSYEQTFPISRSSAFHFDDPNAAVTAMAQTDFVNCRATGQRRAGVHGVISIRFRVFALQEKQIIIGSSDDSLQMRTQNIQAWSMTAIAERTFVMSEVVEVGSDNPPIAHVLHSDASVQIDSVKAVKDKLLVKGEVIAETLYEADDESDWVRFRHSMPVSQIVEVAGVEPDDLLDVSLRIVSLDTTPKADGSGNLNLLEIALNLCVSVRSARLVQMQAVWDSYSTQGVLQPQYGDISLRTAEYRFSETMTVKQTVELPTDVSRIMDLSYDRIQHSFRMDGDTAEIDCVVSLSFLVTDAQDNPMCVEKQAEFAYRKILADRPGSAICNPVVQITGCKGILSADGSTEIRLEVLVSGTVYSVENDRLLLSACVADAPPARVSAAVSIYFSDAGESVWDIARRYGTTVASVMEENSLTEETVSEKRMLVIPTV